MDSNGFPPTSNFPNTNDSTLYNGYNASVSWSDFDTSYTAQPLLASYPAEASPAAPQQPSPSVETSARNTPPSISEVPTCGYCGERCSSNKALRRHEGEQHKLKKIWICPLCSNMSSLSSLARHPQLQCRYCPLQSPNVNHHADLHYACISQFNTKTFKRGHDFRNHVRDAHEDCEDLLIESSWVYEDRSIDVTRCCDRCDLIFSGMSELERHKGQMRGARGDHGASTCPAPDVRLTRSIRGLLDTPNVSPYWQSFLQRHELQSNFSRCVFWHFNEDTCRFLYNLERFNLHEVHRTLSKQDLFEGLERHALPLMQPNNMNTIVWPAGSVFNG